MYLNMQSSLHGYYKNIKQPDIYLYIWKINYIQISRACS